MSWTRGSRASARSALSARFTIRAAVLTSSAPLPPDPIISLSQAVPCDGSSRFSPVTVKRVTGVSSASPGSTGLDRRPARRRGRGAPSSSTIRTRSASPSRTRYRPSGRPILPASSSWTNVARVIAGLGVMRGCASAQPDSIPVAVALGGQRGGGRLRRHLRVLDLPEAADQSLPLLGLQDLPELLDRAAGGRERVADVDVVVVVGQDEGRRAEIHPRDDLR